MKKRIQSFFLILSIFVAWQIIDGLFFKDTNLIPTPAEILQSFYVLVLKGDIFIHIFQSVFRIIVGFCLATVVGVFMAMLLGYYNSLGRLVKPLIEMLRPIPPIAWIPIAILIFGLGNYSAFFIVFLGAVFPIFTNTYFGVRSLPEIYKNVANTFELDRKKYILKVLFPFSLPYIFAGLRIGMGMAWMSVIASELIGAQSGLGYFIQFSRLLLQTDKIIVGMIIIGLIVYLLIKVIDIAEYVFVPWLRKKVC